VRVAAICRASARIIPAGTSVIAAAQAASFGTPSSAPVNTARRPETIIVHTATARHADIVLPATTSLERNDLGGARRDRFVIAMHKAIEPVGDARNDFDIFLDLSRRLGCDESFAEGRDEALWLRRIYGIFRERAHSNLVPDFDTF
jgi:biotin/methionine sulfoxide reductase